MASSRSARRRAGAQQPEQTSRQEPSGRSRPALAPARRPARPLPSLSSYQPRFVPLRLQAGPVKKSRPQQPAVDLAQLQEQLRAGKTIDELAAAMDWKAFEGLVASIFSAHDFAVRRNVRFAAQGRHEIDLVCRRGRLEILIDCKHWAMRRGKKPQLQLAVQAQLERLAAFSQQKTLDRFSGARHALIVTLMEEDIISHNSVWIVPLFKLNAFLQEADRYLAERPEGGALGEL